ncbi:hypothetical protein [Neoroseomonas lacus]|uniref:Uncharacterized protein n=1 Tax=Neoroseomonas lacus TaxID=287609 RepID=A0A917NRK9_9PROT|nr:hypothetical protein [Neoroseomonas lacus]GGJ23165.1 hypothetical protein GCM10011320_33090 [Neoroseomonas lacus]
MTISLRAASCLAALGLLGLGACTVNNPPAATPVVVQQPVAQPGTVIQPGTTTYVPPGSVVVPPARY